MSYRIEGRAEPVEKCFNTGMPIDYIYDVETNSYPLEKYATNEDLLAKIKLGRSEPSYVILPIDNIFAATSPAELVQDLETGLVEDITKAKAASWALFIKNNRNEDIDETMYEVWEDQLIKLIAEFSNESKLIKLSLFTSWGVRLAFKEDLLNDLALVQVAILLVSVYTIFVLGTFSAIHCRLVVSLMGLVSVGFAYGAGFGFMYLCGG